VEEPQEEAAAPRKSAEVIDLVSLLKKSLHGKAAPDRPAKRAAHRRVHRQTSRRTGRQAAGRHA
jgi:hypothetical protein